MTVAELIDKLREFPLELEVKVTDGHRYQFYAGDFEVGLFEDTNGAQVVDIGIGGFDEDDDD